MATFWAKIRPWFRLGLSLWVRVKLMFMALVLVRTWSSARAIVNFRLSVKARV
jgi:hypothetical protein